MYLLLSFSFSHHITSHTLWRWQPLEEIKYLIFLFPYPDNEVKRDVDFGHSTRNICRIQLKCPEQKKKKTSYFFKYSLYYPLFHTHNILSKLNHAIHFQVDQYMERLASQYPNLVTLVNAGPSFEGRPVKYLKVYI